MRQGLIFYQKTLALIVFFLLLLFTSCKQPTYDLILASGQVFDGSGGFIYEMDIGIKVDRVIATGKLDTTRTRQLIDINKKLIVPWIPSINNFSEMTLKNVKAYYQNELHKRLLEDEQTAENAIRSLFSKKVSGGEKGLGLIGTDFPANILVLNLQRVEKYAPLAKLPRDAITIEYVIHNGTILR